MNTPANTSVRQVLIIEDDEASIQTLTGYLGHLPFFAQPVVCRRVSDALAALTGQSFQLILLDMHLPDLSGMDFLRTVGHRHPVVVTTSHPDFAVDSYDLNVADYLLKPFTLERFLRAVGRATDVRLSPNNLTEPAAAFLKIGRQVQRFNFDAIDFVEAYGIYAKIWSNQHPVVVNETLSALTELLPARRFVRVHKSYIINLDKISRYDTKHVWVGEEKIPLGGEAYRKPFRAFLGLLRRNPV